MSNFRRKLAGWFGRKEHWAGRAMGISAGLTMIIHFDIFSLATFILWIVYLFSHTAEKTVYGKHGYR